METKNFVNYKEIKKAIARSCKPVNSNSLEFSVDFDKLKKLVSDLGVTPIVIDGNLSKPVEATDVIVISDYFKGDRLSWIDDNKSMKNIIFLRNDHEIDEEDFDTSKVSDLIANYPCYFALVVGYYSTDPDRFNKVNYLIGCRANQIVLSGKYNNTDATEGEDVEEE